MKCRLTAGGIGLLLGGIVAACGSDEISKSGSGGAAGTAGGTATGGTAGTGAARGGMAGGGMAGGGMAGAAATGGAGATGGTAGVAGEPKAPIRLVTHPSAATIGAPPPRLHQWRRRHARGEVIVVRYADDAVVGFEFEEDARELLVALRERLGRLKLELHPDKTRLTRFRGVSPEGDVRAGTRASRSFCFLGFMHWWGKKANGRYDVMRRTEPRRMRATLKAVKRQLVRRRHDPVPEQGRPLRRADELANDRPFPNGGHPPMAPAAAATQSTYGAELAEDEPPLAPLASAGPRAASVA